MTADLTEQRVRELIREELAARSFFSVEPRDSISEQLHRVKLLINSGRQSLDRIREDLKALREGLKADASRFEFDERRYGVGQKLGGVDTVAAEQQPPRTLDKPGRDGEPAGVDVAHDQLAEAFDVHDSSPSQVGSTPSLGVEGAASGDTGAAHPEGGAR